MIDLCRPSICWNGNILNEAIDILVQGELRYEVNLKFTYPTFEPRTFKDNSNDCNDASEYIYFDHPLNPSRVIHLAFD